MAMLLPLLVVPKIKKKKPYSPLLLSSPATPTERFWYAGHETATKNLKFLKKSIFLNVHVVLQKEPL